MRSQLNNLTLQQQSRIGFIFILILTLGRVFFTDLRPCLPDHDCNAYIKMTESIAYNADLAPHHQMRVLPILLVQGLQYVGLDVESAFRLLSDSTYVIFGLLCFALLNRHTKPITAFSFTLLCLAAHPAMRISLQNVYQACDMMVYPISMLLVYGTLHRQRTLVFVLALMGIFVRQNVFILGLCSLLFLTIESRKLSDGLRLVVLISAYACLQQYYQFTGNMVKMAMFPPGFFEPTYLWFVIWDSKILTLALPLIPLIALTYKRLIPFIFKQWYIFAYIAVVVGQPFVGYHFTGNNFARLALQGVWLIYFIIPMVQKEGFGVPVNLILVCYSLAIYLTWSMSTRWLLLALFAVSCLSVFTKNILQARFSLNDKGSKLDENYRSS